MRYLVRVRQQLPTLLAALLLGACVSTGPAVDLSAPSFSGSMPADFAGSWERDYSRGEDVQGALNRVIYDRNREIQMRQQMPADPRISRQPAAGISRRELNAYISLARLVDEISRPDILTISQDDYEIRIAREDDFSMSCSFYEGIAQGTDSAYGTEVCSWDGDDLISYMILPDGLQISHRFTVSEDGQYMRVITTASTGATSKPLQLQRFYMKFDAPPSAFNCIETLSMKRVCSTGSVDP